MTRASRCSVQTDLIHNVAEARAKAKDYPECFTTEELADFPTRPSEAERAERAEKAAREIYGPAPEVDAAQSAISAESDGGSVEAFGRMFEIRIQHTKAIILKHFTP